MKTTQWYTAVFAALFTMLVAFGGCESLESGNAEVSTPASLETSEVSTPTPSDADDSSTEAALQNRYLAFLREEGYTPSISSSGNVQFKIQGKSYYIVIDEDDEEYFTLLYPNFWSANTAQKRRQATMAASYASNRTKVARVYLGTNNYVSATSEVFLNDPDDYRYIFARMLRTITTAVEFFEEYLDK
jgi:hypothetical protein